MEPAQIYRIGEIAERTGVSVETLRYYERRRLLSAPARTDGGFRMNSDAAVHQVRFIKQRPPDPAHRGYRRANQRTPGVPPYAASAPRGVRPGAHVCRRTRVPDHQSAG